MTKLNTAQRFYGGLLGLPDHPDASMEVAVAQTNAMCFNYRSVKAYGPTPKRPKRRRSLNLPLVPAYTGHRV